MKLYFTHSTSFDFRKDLYAPLKSSVLLAGHDFILPHENNNLPINSKNSIQAADLILAEVSYPSTGQGIELGWAEFLQKKIICFYQEGKQYSSSLAVITNKIFPYKDSQELIEKIETLLNQKNYVY